MFQICSFTQKEKKNSLLDLVEASLPGAHPRGLESTSENSIKHLQTCKSINKELS